MTKWMTLSEMLTAAIKGTESFYEGPLMAKEKLPENYVITTVPEALLPFTRVYAWITMELKRFHESMRGSEPPTADDVRRHSELHWMHHDLQNMLKRELVKSQGEGARAYSAYHVLSYNEIAWLPRQSEDGAADERSFFAGDVLSDLFGVDLMLVIGGRGGGRRSAL